MLASCEYSSVSSYNDCNNALGDSDQKPGLSFKQLEFDDLLRYQPMRPHY